MEDHFYVIIKHDDRRLFRHLDSESATEEAKRLAAQMPDSMFFICRAERVVKVAKPTPPIVVEATNDDPIPF